MPFAFENEESRKLYEYLRRERPEAVWRMYDEAEQVAHNSTEPWQQMDYSHAGQEQATIGEMGIRYQIAMVLVPKLQNFYREIADSAPVDWDQVDFAEVARAIVAQPADWRVHR